MSSRGTCLFLSRPAAKLVAMQQIVTGDTSVARKTRYQCACLLGIFVSVVCGSPGSLSGVGPHVFAGAAIGQHDMS